MLWSLSCSSPQLFSIPQLTRFKHCCPKHNICILPISHLFYWIIKRCLSYVAWLVCLLVSLMVGWIMELMFQTQKWFIQNHETVPAR